MSAARTSEGSGVADTPRIGLVIDRWTLPVRSRKARLEGERLRAWPEPVEQPQLGETFVDRRPVSGLDPPQRLVGAVEPREVIAPPGHDRRVSAAVDELEQGLGIAPDRHVECEQGIGRITDSHRVAAYALQPP